jgi:uncharacterized protein (DUF1697 family)
MIYVALLRGINVGGKNKVEMARLKGVFEAAGLTDVMTYINSGNVVFSGRRQKVATLVDLLETAIAREFGFAIKVQVRDQAAIEAVVAALPDDWANDTTMRCDVLFLEAGISQAQARAHLIIRSEIDDVVVLPGAIIWRVDRPDLGRSGMAKLVGGDLYARMTIRNCNTVRKLAQLMAER